MKSVFIFVALVCANLYFCRAGNTSGNQGNLCATPRTPININVHGDGGAKGEKGEKGTSCNCALQLQTNKPSAHIESISKGSTTYKGNIVIKDWSVSAPNSHLAGGMTYKDGKLIVPTTGRYYIYGQIYYYNSNGRVDVRVNNKIVIYIQPIKSTGSGLGTLYAGGVFKLKAGDAITLTGGSWPTPITKVYMAPWHSYFGAFYI